MTDGTPLPDAVTAAEANRAVLCGDLAWLRGLLSGEAAPRPAGPARRGSALDAMARALGLSAFERDVLLLAAATELDAAFAPLLAAAAGDPRRGLASFGTAMALLPEAAHWSALLPTSPLRRWRLVEPVPAPGEPLAAAPLRVEERILHGIAGLPYLDTRLSGIVELVAPVPHAPLPSREALKLRLVRALEAGDLLPHLAVTDEREAAEMREVAALACAALGLTLHRAHAADLPAASPAEREGFALLWEREVALGTAGVLLLEGFDHAPGEAAARRAALALAERAGGLRVILSGPTRPAGASRPVASFEPPSPERRERDALWRAALGGAADGFGAAALEAVAAQFPLAPAEIRSACAAFLAEGPGADPPARLWALCRSAARGRMEDLAERIEPAADWDDLVLPPAQTEMLRDIAAGLRARRVVHDRWGFGATGARGLGTAALFAGPSGTGKTMAAEVLAREMRLDLFRIDLSQVVSKYIGETEKNLRRVFDAAEAGGAILLFDEADALFGRRSEVKDSHDRYANIEVSYLLQRMEAYRGLAILTTNQKAALDQAFLRRLRFVVQFPFPDAALRAEIWRRAFPPATPTEGLDPLRLARLNLPGGHIRNIALAAAFLAADRGEPVRMAHLLRAARAECAKLDRPLGEAEVGGWA